MQRFLLTLLSLLLAVSTTSAQNADRRFTPFNGLDVNMGNLYRMSSAKTRSISPENFTGEKGQGGMDDLTDDRPNHANARSEARDLGRGFKLNPFVKIKAGETITLANMAGPGAVQHIWMTPTGNWRFSILRIYWDDEKEPSVEVPVGDFFGMGWGEYAPLNSLAVCVNPGSAFNCYWTMPFRKRCRITIQNLQDKDEMRLYYQVDYTLTEVPDDAGYLHAQFRRTNPNPAKKDLTLLEGVTGKGQYVGTYLAWAVHNGGWWGEGEIKFFMDGDKDFPTICGTGTEDYFCGSYNFDRNGQYVPFSTAYTGLHQVLKPDGTYKSQQRFGMYRWHITDPIRFEHDLRVTIQDLGWQSGGRYLPQRSDVSSTVFWYQAEPHAPFPQLPPRDELEIH